MTIDKAIDRLEDLHFEQDDWEYGELTEDCLLNREALRQAIETMRKYQEIEEMVKQYKKFGNIDFSMQIISGVVGYGNDD